MIENTKEYSRHTYSGVQLNACLDGYYQGITDALNEVCRAMYHQCFECNNTEDMQKWDGGNWFRYKLFENVIEQLKEKKNGIRPNT